MTWARRVSIATAAGLVGVWVVPAQAAPKDAATTEANNDKVACEQAFEQAQRDQNDTHFLSATKQALLCSNPRCGDAIAQECTRIYSAIEQATPSVVLAARDATKSVDLNEVAITIDGEPAGDQLDGRPILLDPGQHTFKISANNYVPEERKVLIRTGEKYRQISMLLTPVQSEATQPVAPVPVAPPPAPAPAARKVPVASYVLGGVGIAALGAGVVLRLVGSSDYDHLKNTCGATTGCSSSDVSSVKLKYQLSDVAFGVGAAAVVGAIVVYAAAPHHSETTMAFTFKPTPGGFSAGLFKRF